MAIISIFSNYSPLAILFNINILNNDICLPLVFLFKLLNYITFRSFINVILMILFPCLTFIARKPILLFPFYI